MNTSADTTERTRRITYIVVGAIVVVLLVVALISYRSAKETEAAQQKADQLIAALDQAGLPTPSKDQVVRVLGDDGGAVCDDPNSALKKAILYGQLTNGAAGPGIRPVIADNRVVQGELAVIEVYCPEELPEFTKTADDLKLDDVVNG
jgi:Tfp pilus assembly protein FimT